ncbi:MAG TPA: hypothetical protein VIH09_10300 [Flavobacterium sp.]|uniref:hypothetical protein n=1 Tax=Flavobacterium sp. TaxID=239 RepID=UPI002F417525
MKKINETDLLDQRISTLRIKKANEFDSLREQFHATYESIKPINLLKNTFAEMTTTPGLKSNLLNSVIGLSTGYLSKKLLLGGAHSPIKKVLGVLLQFVVTNVVSKRSRI